jgi:hypothetical protein
MPGLLTGEDFLQLFSDFEHSAQRLETRDFYLIPDEQAEFEQFLAGGPDDPDEAEKRAAWLENVRAATASGKRLERVRVVPEPLTPYLRFELRGTSYNADAGEDIRYVNQQRADALDLPSHDYWIFDSARLALLYFTVAGRFLGAQVVTEPGILQQHARWITRALEQATPYQHYLAEDPTRQDPPSGSA